MTETALFNFLDPIARVWGAEPVFMSSVLRKKEKNAPLGLEKNKSGEVKHGDHETVAG